MWKKECTIANKRIKWQVEKSAQEIKAVTQKLDTEKVLNICEDVSVCVCTFFSLHASKYTPETLACVMFDLLLLV